MYFSRLASPDRLHIPDGFLSPQVAAVGWALAVLAIAYALARTRDQLGEKQIPLMGIMAAFIFAAQAINFPVAGGTSGHLLGGALAAIVLGPWAAVLVMTAVIGLQALLFQDGGLLVMGWNIVNMGVLTAFTGALAYRLLAGRKNWNRRLLAIAGAVGAWLSVEAGAAATAIQLAASGTSPLSIVLPAMAGVHALIGVGEALISVGALLLILESRPDILQAGTNAAGMGSAGAVLAGLLVALLIATFSFTASGAPDGLLRVADEYGFLERAVAPAYQLLPDYTIPFIENKVVSGTLAVVGGTLIVFGVAFLIGRAARAKKDRAAV